MIPRPDYPAIVFDLDGTLLDTWPSLLLAVRSAAPDGAAELDTAALRLVLSEGIAPMFALAAAQLAGADAAARSVLSRAMADHYATRTLAAATPYAGAGPLLAWLSEAGHGLALCTNRDRGSTLALLDQHGWREHFGHVHCLGDGLPAKPHPAPLLATLAQLGRSAQQALFVGDSRIDAACAHAAGVDFAAHLGGYHVHPDDLSPAVLTYGHAGELAQWLAPRHACLLETEDD